MKATTTFGLPTCGYVRHELELDPLDSGAAESLPARFPPCSRRARSSVR